VTRPNPAMKPQTMHTIPARAVARAAAAAALALLATAAQAADVAAGKAKADQVCAACHGKDGNTPIDPSYPRLAGQHRDFLERALLDYKSGARKNAIMAGQAQPLSRADIANLAAYYAGLPGSLRVKR
jgi:cytochrome c553